MGWLGGGSKSTEVKETAEEKALARQGVQQWNFYKTNFAPIENEYFKRGIATDGEAGILRGQASNTAMMRLGNVANETYSAGLQRGIQGNSGSALMNRMNNTQMANAASATAMSQEDMARMKMDDRTALNFISWGQNTAANGIAGLRQSARSAVTKAISDMEAKVLEDNAKMYAVGTAIGMAGGYAVDKVKGMQNPNEGSSFDTTSYTDSSGYIYDLPAMTPAASAVYKPRS